MAMLELDSPVQYVKGIGPARAEALAGKGIATLEDLLYYLPFRYEDRTNPRHITDLTRGRNGDADRRGACFRTAADPPYADLRDDGGRNR